MDLGFNIRPKTWPMAGGLKLLLAGLREYSRIASEITLFHTLPSRKYHTAIGAEDKLTLGD